MKRLALILAAVGLTVAAVTAVQADAPVSYDEYNNGTKVRDWNVLPNTPCLIAGGQRRMVPNGQPLSVCTPATTTTSVAPTTTRPATTTTTAPSTTTTTAATSTTVATTTTTVPATTLPGGVQFSETFDNNTGLNRFRWGIYHRASGYREMDQPQVFDGADNISMADGTWLGDHDLACGDANTSRTLRSEGTQDKTGANDWLSIENFHVPDMVYACRDHIMSSMGDVSGYSIVWFGPDQSFSQVNSVSFDVNLTDLGARKWWKVGVVSDSMWNGTEYPLEMHTFPVRGVVVSDVGASNISGPLAGPDRMIASFGGGASGGTSGPYKCMKIGDTMTGNCVLTTADKMTRYPASLVDNHNGTVTFTVNGSSATVAGKFPACPCHVVFYDQNYTPDKDGTLIGHTWHWDSIVVR